MSCDVQCASTKEECRTDRSSNQALGGAGCQWDEL